MIESESIIGRTGQEAPSQFGKIRREIAGYVIAVLAIYSRNRSGKLGFLRLLGQSGFGSFQAGSCAEL